MPVEFRILGPLEVLDGARPVLLPRGRGRALLALLVLHAGEVVSTERLIDELWGETPPPTAVKALHGLVSALRRRVKFVRSDDRCGVLETKPPGYVLTIDREQVDANRFQRLVEEATSKSAPTRAAKLREALGLWRGPALAEFVYQPFAQTAIAALEELRLSAIEERVDADLESGRHQELVGELEGLAAEYPLRERLREQLMLALYRGGRQAESLKVFEDTRRMLVEELGIEPGPRLQRLESAILRQDPSLELRLHAELSTRTSEPGPLVSSGAERGWLASARKTVTVLVADLTVSSYLGGSSDPEVVRWVAKRGFDAAADVLNRHGATVEGFIGGVVVAVFGVPTAHEDDALRAVRAAAELHQALAALNEEAGRDRTGLAARVGINTGEVVVGESWVGWTVPSGDAIDVAARLQQEAAEGQVLLGEMTRRFVGDTAVVERQQIEVDTRGGRPAIAWRLVDLVPGAPGRRLHRETPLVGRAVELDRLQTAFRSVVRERRAVLLTVIGDAGIGKSRLAREGADAFKHDAQILTGRCPAYGDGITFWPLREVVLQAAGGRGWVGVLDVLAGEDDAPSIAARIAGAIGLEEEPGRAEELFPAMRRFVEVLARPRPLVVILEDVHWAQPMLLDLVEYLAESTRAAVLFLCLARPDLVEQRRDWTQDREFAAALFLGPLGRDESRKLIADRLAGSVLPPETVKRVVDMAQGNPLFVEQLLAVLREERELSIPPSVQALLAARLDRLGPAERDLLRCASVAGIEFSVQALASLVPDEARPFVSRHLQVLEDKELIRPSDRSFLGKAAFTFRHVLIQVSAYRSMTRESRSELHERFAVWLESAAVKSPLEFEEVIGYHLEQAYLHQRDLGLLDERSRAVALRAGERLASAGLRAYERFDMAAAENLLSRAKALLPSDHPQRWSVARRLAETYPVLGRLADADIAFAELLDDIRADEHGLLAQGIRLELLRIRVISGPDPTPLDVIREGAERAAEVFGSAADYVAMSQASYVLAMAHLRAGEMRELEDVARRGLTYAQRSGDVREEIGALWWLPLALVTGATPVPECIRSCEELLRGRGIEHSGVLSDLARLKAMLGEFDEARDLAERAWRRLVERFHVRRALTYVALRGAEVELMAGDLSATEGKLRPALELALDIGERDQISQIAAGLSRVQSILGRSEEAARLAAVSSDQAPAESVTSQALWRTATARVQADRTDWRASAQLVRDAIQLVPHDMLNLRAGLHVDLAEILLAAGHRPAPVPVIREATSLYERKGNLIGALQARALETQPTAR